MEDKQFYSVKEIARLLGISRIAVFKKIKKGQIKAVKNGRVFAIPKQEIEAILGTIVRDEDKRLIDEAIKKTISEYGETLRLLGQE